MASSDLRDVLNLPDGHGEARPNKKQRLSAPRPNLKGLAREVHMLGGDNPIAIVPEVTQFRKRRLANRKPAARWEMRSFHNSAREDKDLILRHWRRKEDEERPEDATMEGGADDGTAPKSVLEDSSFARFNVQVSVPKYDDIQYQKLFTNSVANPDWSREETDYLMGLAQDYDLRWPLIWDRFDWSPPATNGEESADGDESKAVIPVTCSRSMEDLKFRYYEVASKMMQEQRPTQYMTPAEMTTYDLMRTYTPHQEKVRKEFALRSLNRSSEEAREEESLLLEIKRILARSERFNEERRELYRRLDYPHAETDISTFKSSAGLQTLLQNLMTVDKSKKRKSLMGAEIASPSTQQAPQAQNTTTTEGGRRDSTATAAGGYRDSANAVSTPTGATKKGQQGLPLERRKLTTQEEAIYGVTHFDRLGSGPTFRTEKINKLFSHKSNQQQIRINNALNELDVPIKLAMPTGATTQQYEQLIAAVNTLLDARKHSDKIDAELKIEQAKKSEREKNQAPRPDGDAKPPVEEVGEEAEAATKAMTLSSAALEGTDSALNADDKTSTKDKATEEEVEEEETANAGGDEEAGEAGDLQPGATAPPATEKLIPPPASTGNSHKRSASEVSAVSDKSNKSNKRQKK